MHVEELADSRDYLSRISVWPRHLDVAGWLSNFDEGTDRAIAMWLLDSMVHLNEDQVHQAVASTIRDISSRPEFGNAAVRPLLWKQFLESAIVSFPLGKPNDDTASGYIFGRIAKYLGFAEGQILNTEHAIQRLLKSGPASLILLDDLAASGTQFSRNWIRNYGSGAQKTSLQELHQSGQLSSVYYLPVVSTAAAKTLIEASCGVVVAPTYLLEGDYSALAADSRLVPSELRPEVPAFLSKYSDRTGRAQHGEAGFGNLGLALSFHHGCPNNTLPVLQWGGTSATTEGWKALFT